MRNFLTRTFVQLIYLKKNCEFNFPFIYLCIIFRFPVLDFLTQRQSKWQSDLQHQQIQIYQDHTMLN